MIQENVRNQDLSGAREILVVSFGTTYADTRTKTISAIENAAAEAFPEWEIRRSFTSGMIRKRLKERDGILIDDPKEALERALRCGVRELTVQPTHLMGGIEYKKMAAVCDAYRGKFEHFSIGAPLLSSKEDLIGLIHAVTEELSIPDDGSTAAVLMGHGTEDGANAVYAELQDIFRASGHKDYYIATVEGTPVLDDILPQLIGKQYKKVVLMPLMVVAGDHARNDLAGPEEDSWKSILEKEGYEVEAHLVGLGELGKVHAMYTEHIRAAIA